MKLKTFIKEHKTGIFTCSILLFFSGSSLLAQDVVKDRAKVYMVSDAHLDTQWNWDVQTTIKEYVRNTLRRNLFLLKKYPDYIFNFEGGVKYSWMKEYYPNEYEQMKDYIKSGRWHISGSSWEASDVLIPSIESNIRNILLGQEYYRKEFGVEGNDIFLPDCFGFGWTLPSIASHCGLIGFSSQKLDWRVNPFYGNSKHPFTIGLWKGVDGSSIMLAHGYDYGRRWDYQDLSENKDLLELSTRTPLKTVYRYYGTGDTGGSPTLASVASVEKGIHGDGPLEIISASSDSLFKDYLPFSNHPELLVYDGELLMDVHGTGCYTSQAAMKLYNRQNELLGDAAERASVAAEVLGTLPYPKESFTEAWKRFLFHQFHDDLTGTSIPRAYEFSWNDELLSLKQFSGILKSSVKAVSDRLDTRVKGIPVVFYNSSGFTTTDVAELEISTPLMPGKVSVYNENGQKVSSQILDYKNGKLHLLVQATVPATGFTVYDVRLSGKGKNNKISLDTKTVENSVYKLVLNDNGDIVSLFDKVHGKELVKENKSIRLALFTENKSYEWPAWEIMKSTVDESPVSITENVKIHLIENGILRKTLCVEKNYGKSVFRQYIRLYEGNLSNRVDFYNEVLWNTSNALLKAEFPMNIDNEKATYDLGLGSVQRGNNTLTSYEVYSHYWADLTDKNGAYGVTIMNDCKYGWDKPDNNTLRLTLLHTPETQNSYTYQDRQDMGYHTFTYSISGHNGQLDMAQASQSAEVLNQRIKAFITQEHKGELGRSYSFVSSNNENVAIKALKKAEDSDEYVIRVYETGGISGQEAVITFAKDILAAVEADGTEKTIGTADFDGCKLNVSVGRNGIKTYKIRLASDEQRKLQYEYLPLSCDVKSFSWNEFAHEVNFSSGYSYAAELIPDSINIHGVPFRLNADEEFNGMSCKGKALNIPAGKGYNRVYLLASSATENEDLEGNVTVGKNNTTITVPSYTGFIGQWGHIGHTEGYLKDAEVAYVGTHRHSADGDNPYEFTYMYLYSFDVPEGVTEIKLPDNEKIVVFAATVVKENDYPLELATPLYRTSIQEDNKTVKSKKDILEKSQIMAYSGYVNDSEKPEYIVDGDEATKWCDVTLQPNYIDFDLGKEKTIKGWKIVNAGTENTSYITSSCFLQGKSDINEEWRTLDFISNNKRNSVSRTLKETANVRYLRLLVTQPVQDPNGKDVRIYELEVYE